MPRLSDFLANQRFSVAVAKLAHRRLAGLFPSGIWPAVTLAMILAAGSVTPNRPVSASDAMRTVVVVNGQSVDSLTVANHYANLRSIHDLNLVVLEDVPDSLSCSVGDFRSRVLQPLLAELEARGLAAQADLIAYSAGFPTAIRIGADLQKVESLPKIFTPVGSLNGLTTLYPLVLGENPEYVAPRTNYYARHDPDLLMENPFLGGERESYDQAVDAAERQDFQAAIKTLTPLAAKHPSQWPLQFRIAAWHAAGQQAERALEILRPLVAAGVVYRKLLDEESAFDSLRDQPGFIELHERATAIVPNRWPAVPFSGRITFGRNGLPLHDPQQGLRYLLSTALAVTSGRGTTLPEALDQLARSAAADGTGRPAAFYFSNHSDVRCQTRMPLVPLATVQLRQLGHRVLVDRQRLPTGAPGLMGAMIGAASYNWPAADVGLLPGAIVENLTSTSGVLHSSSGQTPMSELIRAGVAGTSGTVTEPYALQFKFPTPLLYAYYAAGCTLAEAFYLSVESPYQLLIVGDPLCRPYSPVAGDVLQIDRQEDDQQLTLTFRLPEPADRPDHPDHPDHPGAADSDVAKATPPWIAMELFMNGKLLRAAPLSEKLAIAKSSLPPGYHEIHLAIVSGHPLQPRVFQSVSLNGDLAAAPELTATLQGSGADAVIRLQVTAAQGDRVAVRHLGRRLVDQEGNQASWEIPVSQTGYGPLRLIPETLLGDHWVAGRPVRLGVPLP